MARVLIIDDDAPVRNLLIAVFEKDGHRVASATEGEAGIQMALKDLPDLIVTDMSLPVKTGWEVISTLKANEATKSLPIIALSSHNSQADRDAGHEAGCDAYVGKPLDLAVLMKNVNAILQRS